MKIYVVTSGEYSDYGIEKVFIDKSKAEKYAELVSLTGYDAGEVEEYDTYDDNLDIDDPKCYIFVSFSTQKNDNGYFRIYKTNLENTFRKYINRAKNYYGLNLGKEIRMSEVPQQNTYEYDELEKKYLKICKDKLEECVSLVEIEGWSCEQVNEWLNN